MIQSLTADMGNMGIHPMHTLPVGNQRAAMEVELRNLSVNTLHTFSADNGNGALQRYPSRVDNMHIPVMHTFPAVHTFPVNIPANNGYNQVQSLSADMENLSLHTMPPLPVNNQKGPKAKKTVRFPDQRQKQLAKVGASTKSSKKKQAAEKQAIAARSSKDTSTTADSSDTEAPVPASMTMKAKPTKAIVLSNPHGQVIHVSCLSKSPESYATCD